MKTEETEKQAGTSEQNSMMKICISNRTGEARDADVWILQDDQENRNLRTVGI